jgi:hypothetical protein
MGAKLRTVYYFGPWNWTFQALYANILKAYFYYTELFVWDYGQSYSYCWSGPDSENKWDVALHTHTTHPSLSRAQGHAHTRTRKCLGKCAHIHMPWTSTLTLMCPHACIRHLYFLHLLTSVNRGGLIFAMKFTGNSVYRLLMFLIFWGKLWARFQILVAQMSLVMNVLLPKEGLECLVIYLCFSLDIRLLDD